MSKCIVCGERPAAVPADIKGSSGWKKEVCVPCHTAKVHNEPKPKRGREK